MTNSSNLSHYYSQVGAIDMLSIEDQKRLFGLIRQGATAASQLQCDSLPVSKRRHLLRLVDDGEAAVREVTAANLRLVLSTAKSLYLGSTKSGTDLADMIQDGNIGLITAIRRFDFDRGFAFSTYAMYWIHQYIQRGMLNARATIRLPEMFIWQDKKIAEAEIALRAAGQMNPSVEQIAEKTGLSCSVVAAVRDYNRTVCSMEIPQSRYDDAERLEDVISDPGASFEDAAVEDIQSTLWIETVRSLLPKLEAEVLLDRVGALNGEPASFTEIAQRVGVTYEEARGMYKTAVARLAHPSLAVKLFEVVDDDSLFVGQS